jgi:hypothetical protein
MTIDPVLPRGTVQEMAESQRAADPHWQEITSVAVQPGTAGVLRQQAPLALLRNSEGGTAGRDQGAGMSLAANEANVRRNIEAGLRTPASRLQYIGDGDGPSGPSTASHHSDAPPDAVVTRSEHGDIATKTTVLLRQTGAGDFLAALVEIQDNSHPGFVTYTKRLFRYNFTAGYWDDVTKLASKEGELSVEWNMPPRLSDEDYVRKIKGPGPVYGLMPAHAMPYLRDQTLPIRNPYTKFEASSTQTELRNSHYATTQLVVQNLSLLLDVAALPGQIRGITSAVKPRPPVVEPELTIPSTSGSTRSLSPNIRLPSRLRSNLVQRGNAFAFRKPTDASQVEAVADYAAKGGAKEIHILTNAHGNLDASGFEVTEFDAGKFFPEDARTQGIIQERYPGTNVTLHDAVDPGDYNLFINAQSRASSGEPGVCTIAGFCYSVGVLHR